MSKNYKDTALAAVVASLLTLGSFTYSPVLAADTAAGAGNGVAIGTGSNAPKAENVAIGKGAGISYSNGASNATGDIVVGNGANINNYASQGGSIAIGKNAKVENMAGGGEASFAFGQTTYSGSWLSPARIPADPTKVVGSIAIGDNTFARTGSTMIGSHNYKGDLGDTTVLLPGPMRSMSMRRPLAPTVSAMALSRRVPVCTISFPANITGAVLPIQ